MTVSLLKNTIDSLHELLLDIVWSIWVMEVNVLNAGSNVLDVWPRHLGYCLFKDDTSCMANREMVLKKVDDLQRNRGVVRVDSRAV